MQTYGWHGINALECALKNELRKRMWEDNTATVLWCIGKALTGDSWKIPSYIETVYPNKMQTDNRTADEIIRDIKERLSQ